MDLATLIFSKIIFYSNSTTLIRVYSLFVKYSGLIWKKIGKNKVYVLVTFAYLASYTFKE